MWLIPLVADHQSTYLTKLKKKKEKEHPWEQWSKSLK
jgi:hypothetical protein